LDEKQHSVERYWVGDVGGERGADQRSLRRLRAGDLAATQALFHPETELRSTIGSIEGEVYRGENLIEDWVAGSSEVWEDFRLELEGVSGEGDAFVAEVRNLGRARGSGIPHDDRRYVAFVLKDRRIWRAQTCPTRDEALEVAGLSE
jgi:ketosteroid isomerase-like protein